jgi:hypothetical protein
VSAGLRARRLAAVVAVVATASGLAGPIAGAQTTQPAAGTGDARIGLVSQDAWTPVGGDARLGIEIDQAPPGASVVASVGQAITSRTEYDELALGAPLGSVLSQLSVPLGFLPPDALGVRSLGLGLQSPAETRDPNRLNVRRPGVYPVDIELRDVDDIPVAAFRTMLVVAEADQPTVNERLRVAWVLPVTAAPSFLPDGDPDEQVASEFRPSGRLGRIALALQANPAVPVTLAPTAETVEAWERAARTDPLVQSTFDALVASTANRTVLDGPYVPIDLPALLDHGLTAAVDDVLARGSAVLGPTMAATVDPRTRVLRPASAAALARLQVTGVDRVIVPAESLASAPETKFTLAQPVVLASPTSPTSGEPVRALTTDPELQALLTSSLSPAQRAQLILASMSLVALEAPNQPRVATILDPDEFDVPSELYDALLTGLQDHPFLQPVTTTEAFDTISPDPPAIRADGSPGSAIRELAAAPANAPAISAAAYDRQRTRLNSFGALTRAGDPAVADADRSLLASVSDAWTPDIAPARANAHLAVVDQAIDELVGQIEVPDPRTITLTSRSGEIPLTFVNDTGYPIRLRAALASEKLLFPEGSVIDLDLPPKSTTVRVAVEARTSGTFPLDLEVTSTDGVLSISQRRLEVRSTFVSTVGWVLMASAVAVLAVWWGIDLRRRRRRRRQPTPT